MYTKKPSWMHTLPLSHQSGPSLWLSLPAVSQGRFNNFAGRPAWHDHPSRAAPLVVSHAYHIPLLTSLRPRGRALGRSTTRHQHPSVPSHARAATTASLPPRPSRRAASPAPGSRPPPTPGARRSAPPTPATRAAASRSCGRVRRRCFGHGWGCSPGAFAGRPRPQGAAGAPQRPGPLPPTRRATRRPHSPPRIPEVAAAPTAARR
eukprot:249054-Chlamydomonas_euryale.AAC.15